MTVPLLAIQSNAKDYYQYVLQKKVVGDWRVIMVECINRSSRYNRDLTKAGCMHQTAHSAPTKTAT